MSHAVNSEMLAIGFSNVGGQDCWSSGCKNLLEEFKREWEARHWKSFLKSLL